MKKGVKRDKPRRRKVFPQVTGRVQMTREGFIFVVPDGEGE